MYIYKHIFTCMCVSMCVCVCVCVCMCVCVCVCVCMYVYGQSRPRNYTHQRICLNSPFQLQNKTNLKAKLNNVGPKCELKFIYMSI